jgi:hypothetical protein
MTPLVANFARPSDNATCINILSAELGANRLELLQELVPSVKHVAVLVNPNSPAPAAVSVIPGGYPPEHKSSYCRLSPTAALTPAPVAERPVALPPALAREGLMSAKADRLHDLIIHCNSKAERTAGVEMRALWLNLRDSYRLLLITMPLAINVWQTPCLSKDLAGKRQVVMNRHQRRTANKNSRTWPVDRVVMVHECVGKFITTESLGWRPEEAIHGVDIYSARMSINGDIDQQAHGDTFIGRARCARTRWTCPRSRSEPLA